LSRKREYIREYIKSDKVNKTINPDKQNRHIRGSPRYIEGRSYLLDGVDAQGLVDRYHSTGDAKFTEFGNWKNRETVVSDRDIGVNIDENTREETLTNKFTIHYGKTGAHIVPTRKDIIYEFI